MVKQEDMTETTTTAANSSGDAAGAPPASAAVATAPAASGGVPSGSNSCSNGHSVGAPHPPSQSTVFIHKLYKILEDNDLKDLIWWSPSGLSFLIRPTERFSRALATYFKHTNIASFVRQLNMYGFHKVSNDHGRTSEHDSHNGQEDIKIWKFRHSTGLFKRGDIEGLKYIKRRSSRNMTSSNGRKNSNSMGHSNHNAGGISNNASGNSISGPNSNNNNSNNNSRTQEDDQEQGWHYHHHNHQQQPQQQSQQQQQQPQQQPQQPQQQQLHQQQQQQHLQQQQPQQQQRPVLPEPEPCFFPPQASQMQQPLAFAPYPQAATPAAAPPGVDPFMEAKFAELSQSYNALKHEHSFLQYRHDEVLDHVRGLNMDMVHLLELLESLVMLQNNNPDHQPQHDVASLEQELIRFKTLLAGRVHRSSDVQAQQYGHRNSREHRPISGLSVLPSNPNVPSVVPHVFAMPARPASATNAGEYSAASGPHPPPPHQTADHLAGPRMMMMNPFETMGNGSKRNMSILMDPLAPAPNIVVAASPPHPQPYMNPSPAGASTAGYRVQQLQPLQQVPQKPGPERSTRFSMVATKSVQSSSNEDLSNGGNNGAGHQQLTSVGTPTGQGTGQSASASAGAAFIKEEQPVSMTVPPRPSSGRNPGDIVRPIPTRFPGSTDNTRGGSAVYSLLNEGRPTSPASGDETTPTKKVKL